ncbi:ATP-binding protein [Chthonobacter rhizosphaerae]|uniref:ATP-binding protein n=1 Tax=Chthonobacter rhizosphaerae TaxID=2735553 RepID=UPI0015EEE73B|nr:ATP-binding protein [Chthonobacter rhizosphaerae]
MTLLARLLVRFMAIGLVCVLVATGYVVTDAVRSIRAEAGAVADLAGRRIELDLTKRRSGYGGGESSFQAVDGLPADALGSGHCIRFTSRDETWTRCAGHDATPGAAPRWFGALFGLVLRDGGDVTRPVVVGGDRVGSLTVDTDPAAAVDRAYRHVATAAGIAGSVTLAMAVLLFAVVSRTLRPLRQALDGLGTLRRENYGVRLTRCGVAEFDALAAAFNGLAERLGDVTRERADLTRRLIGAQEEERRVLARDLHDEFGQCLTAVQSLAAGIAIDCDGTRTAEDARLIERLACRMSDAVRGALARLRPPELDDYGLAESLRGLILGRDSVLVRRDGSRIPVDIAIDDRVRDLPPELALGLFRVAQECLTNAARHGRPGRVRIRATRRPANGPGGTCCLEIEDDGGGGPPDGPSGFGLMGMRERIASLGGLLDVERTAEGTRVRASVPLSAGAPP